VSRAPTGKRSRGRPKDESKRAAILGAAKDLFARQGLESTSMDAIAAAAGVSKLTVYSHFENKHALFQQAVAHKCQEYTPPALFDAHSAKPLRQRLLQIGEGFVDLVMSEDALDLYRMMAAEARGGNSQLGKLFFEAGPRRTIEQFSRLLQVAHQAGELQVLQPQISAQHFFCLLKGVQHLRVLMGMEKPPAAAARKAHVAEVVDLFLRAHARH
jgi:TetR/AcrR family transcriptional regulator, mexJK operon transcriptional repressor